MKALLAILSFFVIISPTYAEEFLEVKAAFKTYTEYLKTDDERCLDLYLPDVQVVCILTGKGEPSEVTLTPDFFFEVIRKGIAKKEGSSEVYKDIKVTAEGDRFRINCTIFRGKDGTSAPYVQEYVRAEKGLMISKVIFTIASNE
jgi:hypothetical protein